MVTNKELNEQIKKLQEEGGHKPVIETIINTTALALTATGTTLLVSKSDYFGFLLIVFGAGLEFFKYWGRKNKFW